ncbi:PREDICTED: uncharacterized protein LOC105364473 [Ceratosolen solmsi marchali]|uniref:Uncharacterized protein LOC105364473 n=1 Tax=Ceratosolen solmsi marchali TaxID=326594 RepID=A0AAJ7DY56_9HYME|nr:PREDICTED: uncharacterized protein LOC105364473 [Ceratosolen solmsi marchali]
MDIICDEIPEQLQLLNHRGIDNQSLNRSGIKDKMSSNIPIIDSSTSNSTNKIKDLNYLKSKKKLKSKMSNTTINYNIIHSNNIKIGSTTKHTYNLNNFQDPNASMNNCNEKESKQMLPNIETLSKSTVEITKEDIFLIKTHIGSGWKEFAKRIGFSKGQIEQFLEDFKHKGISEVLYHILIDWKQSCTKEATIGRLICALWLSHEYDCIERLVSAQTK